MCPVFQKKGNRYLGCFMWDGTPGKATLSLSKWIDKSFALIDC